MYKFKKGDVSVGNHIMSGEGFHISYQDFDWFKRFIEKEMLVSSLLGEETALVVDGDCLILKGDHRKAYRDIMNNGSGSLVACMKYFEENNN